MRVEDIITHLDLVKHCEGGYFSETYRSRETAKNHEGNDRSRLTSIYYLLTNTAYFSYFAVNKSDLILYHHIGDPLKIIFLNDRGEIYEEILGGDILAGHKPQVVCPGGVWKAYDLMGGSYALVGEAVAPGFDYTDMRMPDLKELEAKFPQNVDRLKKYIR